MAADNLATEAKIFNAATIRAGNNSYNYTNPGYGLSLVDTLWNASSYRQPLEQEGNPMTWIEQFWLQISLIVAKKS